MNHDPNMNELLTISAVLKEEYRREGVDPWAESPFAWILTLPSRQKGTVGERLVAGWCAAKGLDVLRSRTSQADRIIGGKPVEIKFSTLWTQLPFYKFQQFRDQSYEYAICLGLSPFAAHCWVIPKDVIMANAPMQHGGAQGQDTRWVEVYPQNPPLWLKPYGGSLDQAYQALLQITKT